MSSLASNVTGDILLSPQILAHYIVGPEHNLIAAKRAYNSTLPVLSLPVEVLCKITRKVAQEVPQAYDGKTSRSWLSVTYVCHFWRDVCLSDALLWARGINNHLGPRSVLAMIERARGVPMAISLKGTKTSHLDLILAESHLKLTKELSISDNQPRIEHIIRHLLSDAPILETLAFRTPRFKGSPAVSFSEDHGKYNFPHLKSLLLKQVLPSWSLPFLGENMTRLEIHNPRYAYGPLVHDDVLIPTQRYAEMLSAIHRMKNLTSLDLMGVFPQVLEVNAQTPDRIPLLYLKNLKFHAPAPLASDFLSRIQVPKSCTVKGWFSSTCSPSDAFKIASFLTNLHAFDLRQPLMISVEEDYAKVMLTVALADNPLKVPPIRLILFSHDSFEGIMALLAAFPLSCLHTLKIHHDNVTAGNAFVGYDGHLWPEDDWLALFDACKMVQKLVVETADCDFFTRLAKNTSIATTCNIASVVLYLGMNSQDQQTRVWKQLFLYVRRRRLYRLPQAHCLVRFSGHRMAQSLLWLDLGREIASIDVEYLARQEL